MRPVNDPGQVYRRGDDLGSTYIGIEKQEEEKQQERRTTNKEEIYRCVDEVI